jgi:hypothetical protein
VPTERPRHWSFAPHRSHCRIVAKDTSPQNL